MDALQNYMQTVLDTADSIVSGVDGVDTLLDQIETVLNVDVNITDINNGITVGFHSFRPTPSQPAAA